MDDFRSKSYADGRMHQQQQQLEKSYSYAGYGFRPGSNPHDFRCYSASYASSSAHDNPGLNQLDSGANNNEVKFKKGKSTNGLASKSWSFNDPELQRKKRVASYKAYAVEGRVKGGFKKSFRWLKQRYNLVVHGWS